MSGRRFTVLAVLGALGVFGATLLAVPGDRRAPDDDLLQTDAGLCAAWAAGPIDPPPSPPPPPPPTCQVGSWNYYWCGSCGYQCRYKYRVATNCSYEYQYDYGCQMPVCPPVSAWSYYSCGSCGEGCRYKYRTANCSTEYGYDYNCPIYDQNKIAGNWKPYGFAVPGDAQYSFTYQDNQKQDFLALAAKGNVIIGDYTSKQFADNVLPKLASGDRASSITQPYAIDPTDAPLGYHTGNKGVMYDDKGRPLFNGDYTKKDGGAKLDGKDRRFYESTLSDDQFKALIDPNDPLFNSGGQPKFDGVLFTNHTVAGAVNAEALNVNGALISRDDALMFRSQLYINHDSRLRDAQASQLALPVSIKRPKLRSWSVCPASGCP